MIDDSDRTTERRVPTWLRVAIPAALILIWFALFGGGGAAFGSLSDVSTNDQAQFLPASAEATEVTELQEGFRDSDDIPAIVVIAGDEALDDDQLAEIDDLRDELLAVDGVNADGASPVLASDDGAA
ncbi:hypothetical protein ACFWWU_37390, partial [Streptomyces sp. NPDC058650]